MLQSAVLSIDCEIDAFDRFGREICASIRKRGASRVINPCLLAIDVLDARFERCLLACLKSDFQLLFRSLLAVLC